MKEELNVMQERKVWHLVDLPPNIDPTGCRWVFALKKNETGEVVRYKARLVGQGFKQIKGISYDDTFSPVVNFSLIRFFFAVLVVGQNWVHIQCDIKCAYLYAPLKEDVFMKQPPGFEVKDFSDFDFAACRDDRVSMGGQIIFIGQAPIVWRTFKEKCISLSTMEAEFIALAEAAKEMTWFDRILGECCDRKIVEVIKEKPTLYVDNLAAIDFVKSPVEKHRSRHIDVKLFFIRDLVYKELFELKYVKSKDNLSDIFTKEPTKHDLEKFVVFKKNVNDTVYS
ncbi:Retrovirus-related Pol polyprotein from transposon RE2 [Araneus ventricosus]|uniref:Retrovirus-related Pol polyprotein from transposon RE2 n=1 Tax=Araneus ventricosus TaxID=182803 RepID=A0A4Y2HY44_ARAVE|nr:Retrovirus-related Pol polyprotein from transposon RE2 [Araneus ventricosus]